MWRPPGTETAPIRVARRRTTGVTTAAMTIDARNAAMKLLMAGQIRCASACPGSRFALRHQVTDDGSAELGEGVGRVHHAFIEHTRGEKRRVEREVVRLRLEEGRRSA